MTGRRAPSPMAQGQAEKGSQATTAGQQAPRRRKTTVDTSDAPQRALMIVLGSMSEKEFQRHVVGALRQRGYRVFVVPDMRRTEAGLPDIVAVGHGRALFWELKSMRGRVRPEQAAVLSALADVPGVDARVIRPSDWDAVLREV